MNQFSPVIQALKDILRQKGFVGDRFVLPSQKGQVVVALIDNPEYRGFQVKFEGHGGYALIRNEIIDPRSFAGDPLGQIMLLSRMAEDSITHAHYLADPSYTRTIH